MFSVDNFYDVFRAWYGWEKTKNNLWVFQTHGSKKFSDLQPFQEKDIYINESMEPIGGAFIMHDQEPFSVSAIDTYREHRYSKLNSVFWKTMSDHEVFLMATPSFQWPIFCHSEKNSRDVQWIKDSGAVECYYFWHGLIARDWFRHWKHRPELNCRDSWQKKFLLYARDCTGSRQYRRNLLNQLAPISDQILHDWHHKKITSSDLSASIDINDAQQTAIHLVAETIFDQDKIHLTEKIFKPMVMKQPFILFGGPNSLQYLKEYGFKTFSHAWDESYDTELNHDLRSEKILKVIHGLNDLSDHDLRYKLKSCQEIVEHNHRHFFSEKFEKILLDELHDNVKNALDYQTIKNKDDPGGPLMKILDSLIKQKTDISRLAKIHQQGLTRLMSNDRHRYHQIIKRYPWASL